MRLQFEPVNPGEQAGLCLRANEDFNAALVVALGPHGREVRLDVTLRGATSTLARHGLGVGPVTLELRATASEYRFSGGTGRPEELGRVSHAVVLRRDNPRLHREAPLHRRDDRDVRDGRRGASHGPGRRRVVRVLPVTTARRPTAGSGSVASGHQLQVPLNSPSLRRRCLIDSEGSPS